MIAIATYSDLRTFQLKPRSLKLTRRYEENEYALVAGDIDISAVDAADIYAAVTSGEEVSIVINDVPASGPEICKFRGTIQSEGADYDPEKEEYSFTALHVAKKIFDAAKQPLIDAQKYALDLVLSNYLHNGQICAVNLTPSDFEFASNDPGYNGNNNPSDSGYASYGFIVNNPDYTVRDYWFDFAKHYRAILSVSNDLDDSSKLNRLDVLSRQILPNIIRSGYDEAIASYKETSKNPQYDCVLFPCRVKIGSEYYNCYAFYTSSGVSMDVIGKVRRIESRLDNHFSLRGVQSGIKVTVPDNCLDLRVPSGMYGDSYPAVFPFQSIPFFQFSLGYEAINEPIEDYCKRHFYRLVSPYMELEVLYSNLLNVNPFETIVVRGRNALMMEIEDDLADETSKITGRVFA
jgi:hypothetical protein